MTDDPEQPEIKVGDRVTLRSGGPQMVCGHATDVRGRKIVDCSWFAGAELRTGTFDARCLTPTESTRMDARVTDLKRRFFALVGEDRDVDWSFIPVGMKTKDDPLGQRGFLSWKIHRDGYNYGKVTEFSQADEDRPEFLSELLATARKEIAWMIEELARQAAAA